MSNGDKEFDFRKHSEKEEFTEQIYSAPDITRKEIKHFQLQENIHAEIGPRLPNSNPFMYHSLMDQNPCFPKCANDVEQRYNNTTAYDGKTWNSSDSFRVTSSFPDGFDPTINNSIQNPAKTPMIPSRPLFENTCHSSFDSLNYDSSLDQYVPMNGTNTSFYHKSTVADLLQSSKTEDFISSTQQIEFNDKRNQRDNQHSNESITFHVQTHEKVTCLMKARVVSSLPLNKRFSPFQFGSEMSLVDEKGKGEFESDSLISRRPPYQSYQSVDTSNQKEFYGTVNRTSYVQKKYQYDTQKCIYPSAPDSHNGGCEEKYFTQCPSEFINAPKSCSFWNRSQNRTYVKSQHLSRENALSFDKPILKNKFCILQNEPNQGYLLEQYVSMVSQDNNHTVSHSCLDNFPAKQNNHTLDEDESTLGYLTLPSEKVLTNRNLSKQDSSLYDVPMADLISLNIMTYDQLDTFVNSYYSRNSEKSTYTSKLD